MAFRYGRNGPDSSIAAAILLSLLLHGLLVLALWLQPWLWRLPPKEPPVIQVELVIPPPPPPPAAPPEPPQLRPAPIAPESTAPPARSEAPPEPRQQPRRPAPPPRAEPLPVPQRPVPRPAPAPPQAVQAPAYPGAPGPEMAQSEQDFFLLQIADHWIIDRQAPRFRSITITGRYTVLANGYVEAPFGKNDPWDMRAMIKNWDEIAAAPGAANFRTAAETFLRAMRLAQPLQLPPGAAGYPKVMTLNIRVGDIP